MHLEIVQFTVSMPTMGSKKDTKKYTNKMTGPSGWLDFLSKLYGSKFSLGSNLDVKI